MSGGFGAARAAAYDAAARQAQRQQFLGMDAYQRHRKMVQDLITYYGGQLPAGGQVCGWPWLEAVGTTVVQVVACRPCDTIRTFTLLLGPFCCPSHAPLPLLYCAPPSPAGSPRQERP